MAKKNSNNKQGEGSSVDRAFRFMIPFSDTVDLARRVLLLYNGYLLATGRAKTIDMRHVNLLSYYFVFGYSYETKQKFAYCYSTSMQYISVLDTEMKKRGILIDNDDNFRTRHLCPDIENMRRLFIQEGSRDLNAVVALFYRDNSIAENETEEEGK